MIKNILAATLCLSSLLLASCIPYKNTYSKQTSSIAVSPVCLESVVEHYAQNRVVRNSGDDISFDFEGAQYMVAYSRNNLVVTSEVRSSTEYPPFTEAEALAKKSAQTVDKIFHDIASTCKK